MQQRQAGGDHGSGDQFAGAKTHHIVHITTDGQLARDAVDDRIMQFARSFSCAQLHGA